MESGHYQVGGDGDDQTRDNVLCSTKTQNTEVPGPGQAIAIST